MRRVNINGMRKSIFQISDEMGSLENLERKIRAEIESVLGISTRIKLVEPRTLKRTEGKSKRVIDRSDLEIN